MMEQDKEMALCPVLFVSEEALRLKAALQVYFLQAT